MRDLLEDFRKKSFDTHRDWEQDFLLPYSRGYNKGYLDYTATLDAQKKADEEKKERKLAIAMFLLSIVGGSILTRVFAGTTLKHVTATVALDLATTTSIKAAQKAANLVYNSPVAQFALGEALDSAGSWISDDLKKKLGDGLNGAKTADSFAKDPFDSYLSLKEWLGDVYRAVDQAADDADAKFKDDAAFKKALDTQLAAPFFKYKPTQKADADAVQTEVTLVLLLRYLLDRDYYYENEIDEVDYEKYKVTTTKKPINERMDSPNYPKPKPMEMYRTTGIGYERVGSTIRKKLNEVYAKGYGGVPMISASDGLVTAGNLRLAEVTLDFIEKKNLRTLASQKA